MLNQWRSVSVFWPQQMLNVLTLPWPSIKFYKTRKILSCKDISPTEFKILTNLKSKFNSVNTFQILVLLNCFIKQYLFIEENLLLIKNYNEYYWKTIDCCNMMNIYLWLRKVIFSISFQIKEIYIFLLIYTKINNKLIILLIKRNNE